MYTLIFKNNYAWPITASDSTVITKSGGAHTFDKQGSIYFDIPGMGYLNFIDLGEKKISGYPNISETWGVLVRSTTTEGYYRYEGGGQLTLMVDEYGTSHLSTTNGTLVPVSLDEFEVLVTGIKKN